MTILLSWCAKKISDSVKLCVTYFVVKVNECVSECLLVDTNVVHCEKKKLCQIDFMNCQLEIERDGYGSLVSAHYPTPHPTPQQDTHSQCNDAVVRRLTHISKCILDRLSGQVIGFKSKVMLT